MQIAIVMEFNRYLRDGEETLLDSTRGLHAVLTLSNGATRMSNRCSLKKTCQHRRTSRSIPGDRHWSPLSRFQRQGMFSSGIQSLFLWITILVVLSMLAMDGGRIHIRVKLKDWLEIQTEVNKLPSFQEHTGK